MNYIIDISNIGNGVGKAAYGGRLDAYSFKKVSQDEWLREFALKVKSAISNKQYLPIIRIADGELSLLFPLLLLEKPSSLKLAFKNVKLFAYHWGLMGFRTSWGEYYSPSDLLKFRHAYKRLLKNFSLRGILSFYWNQNGLDAFTCHNKLLLKCLNKNSIQLHDKNYYPFHFPLALLLSRHDIFDFHGLSILFICNVDNSEKENIIAYATEKGALNIDFYDIPSTSAFKYICCPDRSYDLIFVSAGIASFSILYQLRHMNCPCIDIGGLIHLLGGKKYGYHGDFFVSPRIGI